MTRDQKIQAVKNVLSKYLVDDCLKMKYDGMTRHELAVLILESGKNHENETQSS